MLYKMFHDDVRVGRSKLIKQQPAKGEATHGTQYRQSSFLTNTKKDWNDMPENTVSASTQSCFTTRVPRFSIELSPVVH